uniref:Uncharacterized protein n=1 Tax=Arundo donax TaxID=35708 RepID=A0A0A9QD58_ARUDO
MTLAVTRDPKFLNRGTQFSGAVHCRDTRFGASTERFKVNWHLTIVKIFREADAISRHPTKQLFSSSSSKEGHRELSCLMTLSFSATAYDSFKILRWQETKSM